MIRFRFDPLEGIASKLDRAAARGRYALAAVDAVNEVTKRADISLQRGELRDINLSAAYVKSKTDVTLASAGGKARSEIVTKGDLTVLGNFGPLSRIVAPGAIRKAGPIKGFRSAGTQLAIRKSHYLLERQWFVMRLRQGSAPGEKFGVFVRDPRLSPGKGKREGRFGKRHIYGPAPYMLFKEQIRVQEGTIYADLASTALELMGKQLEDDLS